MSFDDLLSDLARTIARVPGSTADEAREAYLRVCRQLDENPAERQRIDDIADLLEAEETLYDQARAAADRGDAAAAIPLMRKCAEVGTGEAAWLLAQLLEETGDTAEAMIWYQHASDDGDDRADEKLTALRLLRSCPLAHRAGSPQEHQPAVPDQNRVGSPCLTQLRAGHMVRPCTAVGCRRSRGPGTGSRRFRLLPGIAGLARAESPPPRHRPSRRAAGYRGRASCLLPV